MIQIRFTTKLYEVCNIKTNQRKLCAKGFFNSILVIIFIRTNTDGTYTATYDNDNDYAKKYYTYTNVPTMTINELKEKVNNTPSSIEILN